MEEKDSTVTSQGPSDQAHAGEGDSNSQAGSAYTVTDLDSGMRYSCLRAFTAIVPDDMCEVPYSLANFFDINSHVIREIIHIGLDSFDAVPRAPDSFNYVKHRSNETFSKWLKLMKAIGFEDFDFEIAKFQEYCKSTVGDMKVTDNVACCCSDFIINEFLNFVGANRYWFVSGNRWYVKKM